MKRVVILASAVTLLAGATAFAQTTVGVAPSETIVIEPQQRTIIKEHIVKEKVAPITVRERIRVGARLEPDVELRSAPASWGPRFSKYRYVYSNDHVYLVEPTNRTVVQEID